MNLREQVARELRTAVHGDIFNDSAPEAYLRQADWHIAQMESYGHRVVNAVFQTMQSPTLGFVFAQAAVEPVQEAINAVPLFVETEAVGPFGEKCKCWKMVQASFGVIWQRVAKEQGYNMANRTVADDAKLCELCGSPRPKAV